MKRQKRWTKNERKRGYQGRLRQPLYPTIRTGPFTLQVNSMGVTPRSILVQFR